MGVAAETRFEKDTNCAVGTVKEVTGRTFRVEGCGMEASYTCFLETVGGFTNTVCLREADGDSSRSRFLAVAPQRRNGSVARVVDEKSGARGVTADLPLLHQGTLGPWLRLKAKPAAAPDHIWLTLSGSTRQLPSGPGCGTLTLLVNGVPIRAAAKRSTRGAVEMLHATYAFSTFIPLAQKNPTFGVKACGNTFDLPDEELRTARKFFAIRQELTPPPAPAAPPAPAPATPVAPAAPADTAPPASPAAAFPP